MVGDNSKPRRRAWFFILLVALALRLGWGISRPVDEKSLEALPDQREYLSLGRNLLNRGTLEFIDPRFDQKVYAFRMPGYPLLVAACGGNVPLIRAVQAVLDTATAAAAGFLAIGIFGSEAAGTVAVVLVAINPFLIYFSGLVLSDTLYTAVFAWAMVLLQRRRFVTGAALLSLGVLIRPAGLALAVVLPTVAAWAADRSLRSSLRALLVGGVLLALTLLPWAWRNHNRLGTWVFTTTNTGFTLFDGFHDGATGASDQRFVQNVPGLATAGEIDRSSLLQRLAYQWVADHPSESLRLGGLKLLRFWSPVPLSAEFGRRSYIVVGGVYAVVDLLAIVAIARRRSNVRSMALVLFACVAMSAICAVTVGSLRYRIPLEPCVAAFAAGAVATRLSMAPR